MTAVEVPAPFTVSKIRAELVSKGKAKEDFCRTETLRVGVQVVAPAEGETNLHAHPGVDSVWVVLDGQATFYGTEEDIEISVLNQNEMITIPEGTPYWFKCSSEQPVVMLHITANTKNFEPGLKRKNYKPTKDWFLDRSHADATGAFYGGD